MIKLLLQNPVSELVNHIQSTSVIFLFKAYLTMLSVAQQHLASSIGLCTYWIGKNVSGDNGRNSEFSACSGSYSNPVRSEYKSEGYSTYSCSIEPRKDKFVTVFDKYQSMTFGVAEV
jgi:hypothetical protein